MSLRFIPIGTSDGDERGKGVRPQAELGRGQHALRSGVSFDYFKVTRFYRCPES